MCKGIILNGESLYLLCGCYIIAKNITNGDMFVVQTGNQIFTRCLYVQPNNSILIRAKESDFPDYTISRSEESFSILGRVVYVANKI